MIYNRSGGYSQIASNDRICIYQFYNRNLLFKYDKQQWVISPVNSRIPLANYICCIKYCNDRFLAFSNDTNSTYANNMAYSTDDTQTWQTSNTPQLTTWNDVAYGNGVYVVVGNDAIAYSTDNCATWSSATLPRNGVNWKSIAFGNGKFIVTSDSGLGCYSTNGQTFYSSSDNLNGKISFGDGKFVFISNNSIKYSLDGANWQNITLPNQDCIPISIIYGNGKFVIISQTDSLYNVKSYVLTFEKRDCYTDTITPTTTSVVYSAPETTSSYTISSISSGAITLSDNNTYYYNQSGNTQTYNTIGDIHPDYLCFIEDVGIKIGNITIATNNINS